MSVLIWVQTVYKLFTKVYQQMTKVAASKEPNRHFVNQKLSEYDQAMTQLQITDQPMAPCGRDTRT